MITIFLQNAWSPLYAGEQWPRASWLRALWRSRSGMRLKILLDGIERYHVDNTTPEVSESPSGCCPPNRVHIGRVLIQTTPEIVVACGKQAEAALLEIWPGSLLAVPHPAARVVTNELYLRAGRMLRSNFAGRVALRQRVGMVEQVELAEGNGIHETNLRSV